MDSNVEHIFNEATRDFCYDSRVVTLGALRRVLDRMPNEALLDLLATKPRFVCQDEDVMVAIVPKNNDGRTEIFVDIGLEKLPVPIVEKVLAHHLARAVVLNQPLYEGGESERSRIHSKLEAWNMLTLEGETTSAGSEIKEGESEQIPAGAGAGAAA